MSHADTHTPPPSIAPALFAPSETALRVVRRGARGENDLRNYECPPLARLFKALVRLNNISYIITNTQNSPASGGRKENPL